MSQLVQGRARSFERWTHHLFPLTTGQHVYKGGRAAIDLTTGKVVKVTSAPNLLVIGSFDREVDATAGETEVNVNLGIEIEVEWLNNDPDAPVMPGDVGDVCYALDDQSVTMDDDGRSIAGRVWLVDPTMGVAVQKLDGAILPGSIGGDGFQVLPDFAANALALDAIANGALYDVPATAGASTITLPADAPDGTVADFSADGVKNGHTVQYRDETGPTILTTALLASKRHLVRVAKIDGTWRANAYVSP
jgi:hypothetical protein